MTNQSPTVLSFYNFPLAFYCFVFISILLNLMGLYRNDAIRFRNNLDLRLYNNNFILLVKASNYYFCKNLYRRRNH